MHALGKNKGWGEWEAGVGRGKEIHKVENKTLAENKLRKTNTLSVTRIPDSSETKEKQHLES